ncbi:MAG: ImmA/IrrE family metallo-endopeptidase [Dehalococcoidia bacterium]
MREAVAAAPVPQDAGATTIKVARQVQPHHRAVTAPLPTNRQIERRADLLLDACDAAGRTSGPPVPVEWIAEHLLDLRILWDTLLVNREAPVLGGLDPVRGEIVLNEVEARRFAAFPGLEAFTLAHEIGHWVLHVPAARRRQLLLPGMEHLRDSTCGIGSGPAARREQQADRFAAYLLMPARLLLPRCEGLDLSRFPARYKLRDAFGVSITAMNLRLKELGFGTFNARDEYVPGRQSGTQRREKKVRPAPMFAAG